MLRAFYIYFSKYFQIYIIVSYSHYDVQLKDNLLPIQL